MIVAQALQAGRAEIYVNNLEVDSVQAQAIENMVLRRSRREPLQYITGSVEFLTLTLRVGQGVLIPRPETELMAEHAVKLLRGRNLEPGFYLRTTILDLCTGSGCLALALAAEFPGALVYGTDVSERALAYARQNARMNGISNASFMAGHLFDPLPAGRYFDLVLSNPPYVKSREIPLLQPEVRDWEPAAALDGGADGLDFYRQIVPAAAGRLKDGGVLMVEVGEGQAEEVAAMLRKAGYGEIMTKKDYGGIERIVQGRWIK